MTHFATKGFEMKSDEVLKKVEAEAGKVEAIVIDEAKKAKRWLKRFWTWAWATSWKTKAAAVVAVLAVLLCGMAVVYHSPAPEYVTRSEASVMLSRSQVSMQSSYDALSRRMDAVESGLHQLDGRIGTLEAKPEPSKIATNSISRKVPVRRRVRKSSESPWYLP